ncbi:MAG TPA: dockerin type I repeat-containing protein [Planctomycetota bacterium]|nr:dockerin type I repeat-containing protein [Planctomycetota bacterium]
MRRRGGRVFAARRSIDITRLCTALALITAAGFAGTYRAGDVTVAADAGAFSIPIFFTHQEEVSAATVVLDYDAVLYTVTGAAVDENPVIPEWHGVHIDATWASFGFIMDWAPPYAGQTLPAGVDQHIGRFLCALAGGAAPRTAPIALAAASRGDPPLFNAYVVANLDVMAAVVPGTLTITWPAPSITAISPESTAGGEQLTVQGSKFMAGVTEFRLDGAPVAGAVVVSDTTARVPVPYCAEGGDRRITACNGGFCAEGYFTCRAAPVITGVDPAIGSGGVVAVHGSGFYPETTAALDGETVAVTFHDESWISLAIPACATRVVHAIEICNGQLCAQASCECWPGAAIASVTPASTAGDEVLVVSGSGFVPGETVFLLDGGPVEYTVVSATEALVTVPACTAGGPRTLTACNATLCAGAVFQCRGAPFIAAISPAVTTGGVLAIEGGGFYPETEFRVDGLSVAAVIVDDAHAAIEAAPSAERVVRVVQACNGILCGDGAFTCVPAVAISGVEVAMAGGRATLTVRGAGFLSDSAVAIDGAAVPFTLTETGDIVIDDVACAAGTAVLSVCNDTFCDSASFACGTAFLRADANVDRGVDIGDAVRILGYLFSQRTLSCLDAADANDSGVVDIADAVYVLAYLFAGGPEPPPPFGEPGFDPTDDALGCEAYAP